MKRQILSGLVGLGLVSVALGQTAPAYINNDVKIFSYPDAPPVIDATNFINNSAFIDNTFLSFDPYATYNTVNYTNYGVLSALNGFRFDTFNPDALPGLRYTNAANFHNEVGAVVNCGGTNYGGYFGGAFYQPGSLCLVWATNVINHGTINMGPNSLLSLSGQEVSLSSGLLNMEGFETGPVSGMFPVYWGVGQSAEYSPAANFSGIAPRSPDHAITNRYYQATGDWSLFFFPPFSTYIYTNLAEPSNYVYSVVFLQTADTGMSSNNVYFSGGNVVEWSWPSTNIITGFARTNHFRLLDRMIGIRTNLVLVTNGIAPPSTGYRPTYIPTNYLFSLNTFFSGTLLTNSLPPTNIFLPTSNTNTEYSAYRVAFLPTTRVVSELAGQTYSNMPGRIEVAAEKHLDLTSSSIAGLNYLRLTATNHFTQDPGTRILTAIADYDLGVTNATLTVSNLLAPTCPRLYGYVDVFSTRWTNVDSADITNRYYVTMVDSQLSAYSPSALQNLSLRATNVVISDVLNVLSNITIRAENLLITTNGPDAQTPVGQLVFPYGQPLGSNALPGLRTLTNYGVISVSNAATFGSQAEPYWHFINHGSVQALGCSIWATNFVNTGWVDASPGALNLAAGAAALSGGYFNGQDLSLQGGDLLISNHVLNAGRKLTVWATNSLTDGGPGNGSFWMTGVLGFSLPFKPPIANLLGTTLIDTAPPSARVTSQWAGEDLGPYAVGYSNNAALGRLMLDGGVNSSFVFNGPSTNNALYVDYLEFQNYATNFDSSGNLSRISFGPGMKIYYADLIINGVSWAEKLNGKNNGGLNWVPGYAGAFSSTTVVYPDGSIHQLNRPLVESCNLDSNCDGTPNCSDPAPVLLPSQVGLAAALTQATNVMLFWNGAPFNTSYLEYASSLTATNWQTLTNIFVPGPWCVPQQVVDPLEPGSRFYRVRMDAVVP